MPVTINNIANKVSVSHPAVSRALNGNQIIPESTAVGIRKVAVDMGFFPSTVARGLKTNYTQVLSTVFSRNNNSYFCETIQGIDNTLLQSSYSLFVASSHFDLTDDQVPGY